MKKLLTILLATARLLPLAACGGGNTPAETTDGMTTAGDTTVGETTDEAQTEAPTERLDLPGGLRRFGHCAG